MSQMSQLERHARAATAMSVLNQLRHQMTGRSHDPITPEEAKILNDALDLSQENGISHKTIRYSFRGIHDGNQPAALELSEAIFSAFLILKEEGENQEDYLNSFRTLFDTNGRIGVEDRARIEQLTLLAMDAIGTEPGDRTSNIFAAKPI